tara:strand:- start:24334 stop:26811 length:2478 start_codon:yes stop_codon:yes gene_type:complete
MNQKSLLLSVLLFLLFVGNLFASSITITPSGNDQTAQIRNALTTLNDGDKIILDGDFIISGTILLPSDITWELRGTMTLAPNSPVGTTGGLQRITYDADSRFGSGRYTIIGAVQPAKNIEMFGGVYEGDAANNRLEPNGNVLRLRFIQMMDIKDSNFHDMEIKNVSDDCFTLGNGATNNTVDRVVGRDAGGKIAKAGGNAMTDNGSNNYWTDCRAIDGGSDGWTPKCQNSTFLRCTAENNMGPGWGFYARLDGVSSDIGIDISGNQLIDCVAFGSVNSSGVSFDISSNCPGGKVINNFISGHYYDNNSGGVEFRNKDNANLGVIDNNEVDIHCWGNLSLTGSGNSHSWAGGLGTENDSDHEISNVFGSVVCYDNVNYDVNLKGAKNSNITVYRPNAESASAVNNGNSDGNSVTVINFDCSDSLSTWSQNDYCGTNSGNGNIGILQAEDASMGGGVIVQSNHTGYNGTGFVNFPSNGGYVQFSNIDGGSGGTKTMTIRFANGGGNTRTGVLKINGTSQSLGMETTGGWSVFVTKDVTVNLNSGTSNTIRFESSGADFGNLDQIEVEGSSGVTNDVIISDSFETGYGNWVDGGADCIRSTGNSSDGSYSVKLVNDNPSSLVYSDKLDMAAYGEAIVEFWYAVDSYESSDEFELQVSTNDGTSYATVGTWDLVDAGDVNLTISNVSFTSDTRFRFVSFANSSNDIVYLDEVKITGVGSSAAKGANKKISSEVSGDFALELNLFNYPNPFKSETTISFNLVSDAQVSLRIYNIHGQEISTLMNNESCESGAYFKVWNASSLESGVYIYVIHVVDEKGTTVERKKMYFIK